MSYNLHVIRPSDFVRPDANGKYDLKHSRAALQSVAKACIDRNIEHALLDVRQVQPNLTLAELYQLARTFHLIGFDKEHKLAVLHRYNDSDRAEFFTMCANDRGWNMRSFDNFEDAIEWFSEPTDIRAAS